MTDKVVHWALKTVGYDLEIYEAMYLRAVCAILGTQRRIATCISVYAYHLNQARTNDL